MASFGADEYITDIFLRTYKIQEKCFHLMVGLLPLPNKSYKFVQICFMGGNEAKAQQRCIHVHRGLELNIVMMLQETFLQNLNM